MGPMVNRPSVIIMKLSLLGLLYLAPHSLAVAAAPGWPFDVTTLTAPDGTVAKFVSVGATLTELWVKDKFGAFRDVVLGYDDNTRLLTDPDHPVFNPIVGRYANRIKGGLFSIPISKDPEPSAPSTYHIPTNGDVNSLHGGILGWDRRNWTLVSRSPTSVTYSHIDAADEGFPGNVTVFVKHTVKTGGTLTTTIFAQATEKTPIMCTQHIYWNLDAFQGSTGQYIFNHTLQINANTTVDIDSTKIPLGSFSKVAGTPYDFRTPKQVGWRWNETIWGSPPNNYGYDNEWIYTNSKAPGTSLWSTNSGIRVDITTNQPAVQVYTGNWLNTTRKAAHGGPSKYYDHYSSIAIEQQGYIAAINTPEWGVDQIYYPGRDFYWETTYQFSVVH